MIRRTIAALVVVFVTTSLVSAQAPTRFRWQSGQVLVYRAEHATIASYTMGDTKSETQTKLVLTKRWQVLDVDAAGVATLQLSLPALTFEAVTPGGEKLSFDSANPDKSSEQMRKKFGPFVGGPVVVVRIDALGKVIEVKEAKGGFVSAAKYESDPPFKLSPAGGGNEDGPGLGADLSDHPRTAAGHRREVSGHAAIRLQERRRQSGDGRAGDGSEGDAGRSGRSGAAVADAAGGRDRFRYAIGPAPKGELADR